MDNLSTLKLDSESDRFPLVFADERLSVQLALQHAFKCGSRLLVSQQRSLVSRASGQRQ